MSDWRDVQLGDVADITVGFVGTMARHYEPSGIPFLRSQNVLPHRLDMKDVRYISETFHRSIEKSSLRPGDVVTVRTGNAGLTAVVPGWLPESNCADLVITRPGPDLDARWLSYYLNSAAAHAISTELVGAVQQHFNVSAAKRTNLRLPPLAEQQAIAEVLGALDDKIATNTTLAATARELGVAMLRIDGATTALGDVVAHHKQQTNPLTMDATIVEHYSLPAFDSGLGPEIVDPGSIKSNKFSIHGPAVLVSKLNPQTPRVWPVLPDGSAPRLASTEFLVLEPRVTSPWVMWALLSQPSYARSLQAMVAGTSGSHQRVRPDDVLASPILDPRAIPQQLLADVGEVLAPIDVLSQENRTLAATRDALLPQLMSGKLRVHNAQRVIEGAGV